MTVLVAVRPPAPVRLRPALWTGVALWAAFALPIVLFSGLFPMDVQFILATGAHFRTWLPWIVAPMSLSGRYFPVYWLYNAAQFQLFGTWAGGYLAVQGVVLAVGSGLGAVLVVRTTGKAWLATLAVVLWYLNTPLAENISSVGKAEPLACVLILAALVLFQRSALLGGERARIWWPIAGSAGLVLLAIWTKETSVVAVGVAASGTVLSFGLAALWRRTDLRVQGRAYGRLLGALVLVAILSQTHRLFPGVPPPGAANVAGQAVGYITFSVSWSLMLANVQWYFHQQPDVFVFAVAGLATLAWAGTRLWRHRGETSAAAVADFVFVASVFAAGAVYFVAMWLWRWPMAYYLLFPSVVFKIAALYGSHAAGVWDRAGRLVRWAAAALVGAAALYAACYGLYVISSQVAYSRIYDDALRRVVNLPGTHKTLDVETFAFFSEQADVTDVILNFLSRQQGGQPLTVHGILDAVDPNAAGLDQPGNAEMLQMLGVTPDTLRANEGNLPHPGDYLLAFTGSELATWFVRGVAPFYGPASVLREEGAYDLERIAARRLMMPGVYINIWTGRPSCAEHWLGFELYRVTGGPNFVWHGRYPDGWSAQVASVLVNPSYGRPVVIKFSAPPSDLPQTLTIRRDGAPVQTYDIVNTDEQTLSLSPAPDRPELFTFEVGHMPAPDSPRRQADPRPTGVLLRLDATQAPHPPTPIVRCW